jgi:nitrogen regulatory protein PII
VAALARVEEIISLISAAAKTGKIFIGGIAAAVRVRNNDRRDAAL